MSNSPDREEREENVTEISNKALALSMACGALWKQCHCTGDREVRDRPQRESFWVLGRIPGFTPCCMNVVDTDAGLMTINQYRGYLSDFSESK